MCEQSNDYSKRFTMLSRIFGIKIYDCTINERTSQLDKNFHSHKTPKPNKKTLATSSNFYGLDAPLSNVLKLLTPPSPLNPLKLSMLPQPQLTKALDAPSSTHQALDTPSLTHQSSRGPLLNSPKLSTPAPQLTEALDAPSSTHQCSRRPLLNL